MLFPVTITKFEKGVEVSKEVIPSEKLSQTLWDEEDKITFSSKGFKPKRCKGCQEWFERIYASEKYCAVCKPLPNRFIGLEDYY